VALLKANMGHPTGDDLATLSGIMGYSAVGVTANFYSIFTVDELQHRHDEFSPLAGV
jgi:hypothetical protein